MLLLFHDFRFKRFLVFHSNLLPLRVFEVVLFGIQLKYLQVAEARRNNPISRYSANQIAPFQPINAELALRSEFFSTLTKVEMAITFQQVHGIFFDKSEKIACLD